jgi:hypothetical protein
MIWALSESQIRKYKGEWKGKEIGFEKSMLAYIAGGGRNKI